MSYQTEYERQHRAEVTTKIFVAMMAGHASANAREIARQARIAADALIEELQSMRAEA